MNKYELCIFDLDGTLLYTLEDLKRSINYMMDQYHLPTYSLRDIEERVGDGLKKLLERCVPENMDDVVFNKMLEEFLAYYQKHQDDSTKIYDGILPLIEQLKKDNMKLVILSNKVRGNVEVLSHKHFGQRFDLSLGQDPQNGYPLKPNPQGVIKIMKTLSISANKVAYIGDGETDFEVAKNAGIDFYAVTWGYRSKEMHQALGAKHIVDNTQELYHALTTNE